MLEGRYLRDWAELSQRKMLLASYFWDPTLTQGTSFHRREQRGSEREKALPKVTRQVRAQPSPAPAPNPVILVLHLVPCFD